jgi:hypothetical protein
MKGWVFMIHVRNIEVVIEWVNTASGNCFGISISLGIVSKKDREPKKVTDSVPKGGKNLLNPRKLLFIVVFAFQEGGFSS